MKHIIALLCTGLLLSTTQAKEVTVSPSAFENSCSLGSFSTGELSRIIVPGVVYDRAYHFPHDMRIFDTAGQQWPFVLDTPKPAKISKALTPTLLNKVFVSGTEPYLQFDINIEKESEIIHNQIELSTTGTDFIRRVEVFSTQDPQATGKLATGYLIHFPNESRATSQTIRYPDSDHRSLRVRIYSNAQSSDESFDLRSARIYFKSTRSVEKVPVPATALQDPQLDETPGIQTFLFDVGFKNQPIESIRFVTAVPSFVRRISIYGRNSDEELWRYAGGGEIHRLEHSEDTSITLHSKNRFLKVEVYNYDDQPLLIEEIQFEAMARYIVLEAASDLEATLYFRGQGIKAPRYDLAKRIKTAQRSNAPIREIQPYQTHEVKRSFFQAYSTLLGGLAVTLVSLIVLWVIISMLRQQKIAGS